MTKMKNRRIKPNTILEFLFGIGKKRIEKNLEFANNYKERKLWKKVPSEVIEILIRVKSLVKIKSYKAIGPGWQCEIEIKGNKFKILSEYLIISLGECTNEGTKLLYEESRNAKFNPKKIVAILNKRTKETKP